MEGMNEEELIDSEAVSLPMGSVFKVLRTMTYYL